MRRSIAPPDPSARVEARGRMPVPGSRRPDPRRADRRAVCTMRRYSVTLSIERLLVTSFTRGISGVSAIRSSRRASLNSLRSTTMYCDSVVVLSCSRVNRSRNASRSRAVTWVTSMRPKCGSTCASSRLRSTPTDAAQSSPRAWRWLSCATSRSASSRIDPGDGAVGASGEAVAAGGCAGAAGDIAGDIAGGSG